MSYCSTCGSKIESNERFCANCGQQQQPKVSVSPYGQLLARKSGIAWAPLVLGVVIMVSVFLPWVSVSLPRVPGVVPGVVPVDFGFDFKETAAGTEVNWGILSLIMGFICVVVAFLPMPRIRGIAHVGAGALAAIGIAGYWGAVEGALGWFGVGEVLKISPGIGLYLCLVAAIAVIVNGIVKLRQE